MLLIIILSLLISPAACGSTQVPHNFTPLLSAGLTYGLPTAILFAAGDNDNAGPLLFRLSSLSSGAGFFYLKEYKKAAIASGTRFLLGETFVQAVNTGPGDSIGRVNDDFIVLTAVTWQDVQYYNTFSAYNYARVKTKNRGFKTPLHRTSFKQCITAPFKMDNINRKSTLIPLGLLAAIGTLGYLGVKNDPQYEAFDGDRPVMIFRGSHRGFSALALSGIRSGMLSMNAGVGEEALFRGVIQTELTELINHRIIGLMGASALFGLAHWDSNSSQEERQQKIFTTGLIGAYLGWLYMRNNYRLEQPIAFHFWWDVIAFTYQFLTDPNKTMGYLNITRQCSFIFP
ncbi:MAG: CPBP family intramembrane glutamic endopeptidase [bacterium]